MVNKPIRVVRVLEYEYPSYSAMIEDMKRWGVPASGVKQFNPDKAVIWSSLIPAHSGSHSERFAPPTQNWWPGDSCEFLISEDTWVTGKVQTVHLDSMSCLVLDSDGAETRVWFKDMRPAPWKVGDLCEIHLGQTWKLALVIDINNQGIHCKISTGSTMWIPLESTGRIRHRKETFGG